MALRVGWKRALFGAVVVGGSIVAVPSVAVARSDRPTEVPYQRLRRGDVEVFMAPDATSHEIAAVRQTIRNSPEITRFAFLNHQAAGREFARIFRANPDLVRDLDPADLPVSFRVVFASADDVGPWIAGIESFPGVAETTRPGATARSANLDEWAQLCAEHDFVYELFMRPEASVEQITSVRAAIDRDPRVAVLQFLTQADALREFRKQFAGDKRMLRSVTGADLPTSFRLRIDRGAEAAVVQALQAQSGVDEIDSPAAMCDQLDTTPD